MSKAQSIRRQTGLFTKATAGINRWQKNYPTTYQSGAVRGTRSRKTRHPTPKSKSECMQRFPYQSFLTVLSKTSLPSKGTRGTHQTSRGFSQASSEESLLQLQGPVRSLPSDGCFCHPLSGRNPTRLALQIDRDQFRRTHPGRWSVNRARCAQRRREVQSKHDRR